MSFRAELNELRAELDALKSTRAVSPSEAAAAEASANPAAADLPLKHLLDLAEDMLDEAEDTIVNHPKAAIAGALALGLVIGRLTAR
jgi:ElaB/YqjD/DUF883 family membrane-anchored ribosome-binding protein